MSTEEQAPHISITTQYIKDLSFENPNAPMSLGKSDEAPSVELNLDIDVKRINDSSIFQVALNINATAKRNEEISFVVELVYEGIFHLINVPEENFHFILGVHCPSMLFPFARRIIGDVTQSGGFQPLMIDPIDFAALYQKRIAEEQGN